jgi:diacylglycerol O-acyltransferase / wax synthase
MNDRTTTASRTMAVPVLDAGWLWLESENHPMHATLVCVFGAPPGAKRGYVGRLVAEMRDHPTATPPFDRRLKSSVLGNVLPRWEVVETIDTRYHVRHHALPAPGSSEQLDDLVSTLHSSPLDKAHPLWTIHVIEGLQGGGFAVAGKMHHALMDGVGAARLVGRWLSESSNTTAIPPIWAIPPRPAAASAKPPASVARRVVNGLTAFGHMESLPRALGQVAGAPLHVGARVTRIARGLTWAATGLSARPRSGPHTSLNDPISCSRRIVTTSFELERFRRLADAGGATINDVVLAVCSGALRDYLAEHQALPEKSLLATIPVALPGADHARASGNAITFVVVGLATTECDGDRRLDRITAGTRLAKERLTALDHTGLTVYSLLGVATPILAEQLLGLGGRITPTANVAISNVPGPRKTLYYNGAPLQQLGAITVLYGGQALNIVAMSYTDTLQFTLTACDSRLPDVERLTDHCRHALERLEDAICANA